MAKRLAKIAPQREAVRQLNVMFFVEPFPVRCRPLDYGWVLHRWKSTVDGFHRRGHRTTFVASDEVAQVSQGFPGDMYSPASMGIPTPCYRSREACDEAWCDLMRNPHAQPWRAFIASVLDATQPDIIVSWTYNAPLRAEAAARGKLVMHAELGPTRPPHPRFYYFDPSGFNSDTALEKVWPHFRDQPLSSEQTWEVNTLLRDFIVRPPHAQTVKQQLTPYGKPLLIYFLQVRRDSNMLKWSPAGNVRETLSLVKSAVDPDKFTLLVKPHPVDAEGAELVRALGMRLTPSNIPTATLTSACDLALSCNSSVGFEALCQGKIVYTLGQSAYAQRGVTRDFATRPEALRPSLLRETFVPTAAEISLRQRFLHFMFFRYLIPEQSFWDSDSMALRLESWNKLVTTPASLASLYQHSGGMSVLHELRATAKHESLQRYVEHVDSSRAELTTQLAAAQTELQALKLDLNNAHAQLAHLANSATQRAADHIRAVPGLHAFYLGAKQVAERFKPMKAQRLEGSRVRRRRA